MMTLAGMTRHLPTRHGMPRGFAPLRLYSRKPVRRWAAFATLLCTAITAVAQENPAATRQSQSAPVARPAPKESSLALGAPRPATDAGPASPSRTTSGTSSVAQTVLALAGVLSAVGIGAFALKRFARRSGGLWSAAGAGGRSPAGIIEVLGRYPLGRGQTLLLIRLDRRVLLVGQSGASRLSAPAMATLSELVDPEEVASILTKTRDADEEKAAARFTSLLRGFDRDHASVAPAVVDVKPRGGASPQAPTSLRARLETLRPANPPARSGRAA